MPSILVIGSGSIGKRHVRNLLSLGVGAHEVCVAEPREDRRGEACGLGIPGENVFPDAGSAISARRFDGGGVATPTSMHYRDALTVARSGAHLMIEKPLGVDIDGCDELQAEVDARGLFAFVAYCFRFDSVAQTFAELVRKGEVGTPLYARAEMSTYLPEWHPQEDYREFYMAKKTLGGGTLLDQSHLFDLTRMILGDVRAIYGISRKVSDLEIETDDFGEFVLSMQGGATVSLHIDLFTRPWREFFQLTGLEGTLKWNITTRTLVRRSEEDGEREVMVGGDYNQMYVGETAYFLDAIRKDGRVEGPTLADGRAVMDLISAVRRPNGVDQIEL